MDTLALADQTYIDLLCTDTECILEVGMDGERENQGTLCCLHDLLMIIIDLEEGLISALGWKKADGKG